MAGTRLLAETLAKLKAPPKTLVCASAIGFYGDRSDQRLNEDSPAGTGFLADTCREWEAAAKPAADRGIRVVHLRTGRRARLARGRTGQDADSVSPGHRRESSAAGNSI